MASIVIDGHSGGGSALGSDTPGTRIDSFLRESGGSNQLAVNGSVTPVEFAFTPDDTRRCEITRILFSIRDNGASGPDEFGAITNGITNGITLKTLDSGDVVTHDFLDGETIKTNGGFAEFSYDVENLGRGLSGDDIYAVRWTFGAAGEPLTFEPGSGQRLAIEVSDDLSSLVWFRVLVQGFYVL